MNRDKIKIIQNDLKHSRMKTSDAGYLAGRLEDLVSAILEDEKTSSKTTWTFSPTMALIELRDWTRLTEVQNYARFHDIAVPEAIERLVNSGLSHEHRG